MSTCYLGESGTTMPGAFAIAKTKAGWGAWAGPSFYLGYLGEAWDSDEYAFETRFWSAIGPGYGVGQAFDIAKLGSFNVGFGANWYLSLIHISEPTRLGMISYAVFCLKKKKK